MKRKVIPVLIGLLLIVLILAGAAGVFLFQRYSGSKEEADLNAYFGLNGSQEVAIVWNQELTEEKGLLQDERCYLKLDTVHEMLNERFYVVIMKSCFCIPSRRKRYRLESGSRLQTVIQRLWSRTGTSGLHWIM